MLGGERFETGVVEVEDGEAEFTQGTGGKADRLAVAKMAVDGDEAAHAHAVEAATEVDDGGAQGVGGEGQCAGPALGGPGVAIGNGGEQQGAIEVFGYAAGDAAGQYRVGEERQMRAVLLDGSDWEDGDEAARDCGSDLFPAGGGGVEHQGPAC